MEEVGRLHPRRHCLDLGKKLPEEKAVDYHGPLSRLSEVSRVY